MKRWKKINHLVCECLCVCMQFKISVDSDSMMEMLYVNIMLKGTQNAWLTDISVVGLLFRSHSQLQAMCLLNKQKKRKKDARILILSFSRLDLLQFSSFQNADVVVFFFRTFIPTLKWVYGFLSHLHFPIIHSIGSDDEFLFDSFFETFFCCFRLKSRTYLMSMAFCVQKSCTTSIYRAR